MAKYEILYTVILVTSQYTMILEEGGIKVKMFYANFKFICYVFL